MSKYTKVVVVESPAKAKTINKYLGSDYHVLASYGHVRDLPPRDGSVDPDNGFDMLWMVDGDAERRVKDIAKSVKSADTLILATDPDREGEAISWHINDELAKRNALAGKRVERVVFNEITKAAIKDAFSKPRHVDQDLVDVTWRGVRSTTLWASSLACSVAQAARKQVGRPRAVRCPTPHL